MIRVKLKPCAWRAADRQPEHRRGIDGARRSPRPPRDPSSQIGTVVPVSLESTRVRAAKTRSVDSLVSTRGPKNSCALWDTRASPRSARSLAEWRRQCYSEGGVP
jgi:hypothetical protein